MRSGGIGYYLEFERIPASGKASFTSACYDGGMDIARLSRIARGALCAASLLPVVLLASPAHGENIVLTSKKPYWAVGVRDDKMSRACSLQRFNLKRTDKLVARFIGPEGADTLAIGKGNGGNIYDPEHLGKPTEDYYFHNQNTTSCEVYVGGRGKGAATPRPPR